MKIVDQPLVSIITVNYHQDQVTCELLNSIKKLKYKNIEVIVVDNEVATNNSNTFKSVFAEVLYLYSKINLGFAGGNNLGMEHANGNYIFLVNNDTELNENCIQRLVYHHESEQRTAAISPIIRYYEEPSRIQFAGFTAINKLTGRNKMIRQTSLDKLISTPYFHGAAVMIKSEAIEEAGTMAEDYFLYYEELDWSVRFTKHGWCLKVANDAEILHKESISTGQGSPLKLYYQTRNRLLYMHRHANGMQRSIFKFYYFMIGYPWLLIKLLYKRKFMHLSNVIKAVEDYCFGRLSNQNTFIHQ